MSFASCWRIMSFTLCSRRYVTGTVWLRMRCQRPPWVESCCAGVHDVEAAERAVPAVAAMWVPAIEAFPQARGAKRERRSPSFRGTTVA